MEVLRLDKLVELHGFVAYSKCPPESKNLFDFSYLDQSNKLHNSYTESDCITSFWL